MEEEEIKVNNIITKKGKILDKNTEIKEVRLEKISPGFNLVSLKARHRLNELKKLFSGVEYRDYIRKCKNMYSISSLMNSKYSISDLYLREKYDINSIVSVFNKIDSKLDSQKIKVTRIKKNKIKNMFNEQSKSSINFFKNQSNFNKYISNTNNNFKINKEVNNSLSFNNKNLNNTSYNAKSNLSNLNINETSINNKMSKTTYANNKKNKILNCKYQLSLNNIKNNDFNKIELKKDFSNAAYQSLISDYKENNKLQKSNINNKIKLIKLSRNNSDFSGIYNMETKQFPLSCKNSGLNITKFGAIIFKHSLFRNKKIKYFLPKNYYLPLLYNNKF